MSDTLINKSTALSFEPTDSKALDTPIVQQLKKLQQMFLINDPATTFGKSLGLLFALIKSMILGWLALCWGIVGLSLAGATIEPTYQRLKDW